MLSALSVIDVVAEAQNILVKFIDILKGSFHLNPLKLSLVVDDIGQPFRLLVELPHKSPNSLFFMEYQMLRRLLPQVIIDDGQPGI